MPPARDMTMLKMNSTAILIAMAEKEWEPKNLAEHAGVTYQIACIARRGCKIKPKYAGKIAKALGLEVKDIVEVTPRTENVKEGGEGSGEPENNRVQGYPGTYNTADCGSV